MSQEFWICWKLPQVEIPKDQPVLAFLSPTEEQEMERRGVRWINGRRIPPKIRQEALDQYLDMTARLGLAKNSRGQTFRQALGRSGEASSWWYHPASFRDCEADPAFNYLLQIFFIRENIKERKITQLALWAAPASIERALRSVCQIRVEYPVRELPFIFLIGRALLSRIKFGLTQLSYSWRLRHFDFSHVPCDGAAFFGYWPWSVRWDEARGTIVDHHYAALPETLKAQTGLESFWLAWFYPEGRGSSQGRFLEELIHPAQRKRCPVVFLQSFLGWRDIVLATINLNPLWRSWLWLHLGRFKNALLPMGEIDFMPLFTKTLVQGSAGYSLVYGQLMALSVRRACERLSPRWAFHFQEHFPPARAFYEGARQSSRSVHTAAIQHASYAPEKTLLCAVPGLDTGRTPDGENMPMPERFFALGPYSASLFQKCGYEMGRIMVTGSPRYDWLRSWEPAPPAHEPFLMKRSPKIVLLACTLNVSMETDMIEAVSLAARGLRDIRIRVRTHPYSPLNQAARLKRFGYELEFSKAALSEDLAQSDLVLVTYSTVGEEAFLMGKPVWRWAAHGFNGSALFSMRPEPQFDGVFQLRRALESFCQEPERYRPCGPAVFETGERLFFKTDGRAAHRIAGHCQDILGRQDNL
ncbi:MAG: hypothetical protein HY547_03965 [Elusimicrobia bacterium]|nr:hypothetical protein [Elusimicrobiota bacterium]